jgi:two-component system OmpR family sensor kinase
LDVQNSDEDKLSFALVSVESHEISLIFQEVDGSQTILQEVPFTSSEDSVVMTFLDLGDGEKLIFKISVRDLENTAWSSTRLSLMLAILAAVVATFLSRRFLARDLAHINTLTKAADAIAQGKAADLRGLGTSIEITELSRSLETMVKRLKSSKDEMQDFLSDTSHELRTPLTVIRGYLEMLQTRAKLSEDKITNAVSRAHAESLRMQQLINDILTLAELGQLPKIDAVRVNLGDLIQDRVEDFRSLSAGREVRVQCVDSAIVHGHKEFLVQLFANIFGNINNHTPPSATVVVAMKETANFIEISVDDSGPGIKYLQTGSILTEFRRFDATRSRVSGGSGLGLSIMARIVELHKGKLELSKSSLGGLRVLVKLPKG